MRRFIPFVIVIIGVAALIVDFWPNLKVPGGGDSGTGPRTIETRLGLDLQGGLRVEYEAVAVDGKTPSAGDMETIKTIIENRVNSTGVTEPLIQTVGADRIVVEMPGISNPDDVRRLLGQTGRLDFVPLPAEKYGNASNPGPLSATQGQPLPSDEKPLFSGDQIDSANASTDQTAGRVVAFTLKPTGAKLFGDYTSQHVGEFFAIVLDGVVVSAPSINSAITGGSGIITGGSGGFAAQEVKDLVTVLKYGSLPFPIREVQYTTISPTLGTDFLNQSLLAGAIGIGIVFIFMLVYYRLPGLVADAALVYYALVVLAIFRLVPVTLTLAGIAGFVLSVGMAVDANVLIFERTKEELRAGKSLNAAVEAGFNRAWNSILDSNVSSLITAGILYWFGSSIIRGFALVLIIGVLVSMFSAVTVTRTILRGVIRWDGARSARLWGVHEDEFETRAFGRPRGVGEARGRV